METDKSREISEFAHAGITYISEPPIQIPQNYKADTLGEIIGCAIRTSRGKDTGFSNKAADEFAEDRAKATTDMLAKIDSGASQMTVLGLMHAVLSHGRKYRISIKEN